MWDPNNPHTHESLRRRVLWRFAEWHRLAPRRTQIVGKAHHLPQSCDVCWRRNPSLGMMNDTHPTKLADCISPHSHNECQCMWGCGCGRGCGCGIDKVFADSLPSRYGVVKPLNSFRLVCIAKQAARRCEASQQIHRGTIALSMVPLANVYHYCQPS